MDQPPAWEQDHSFGQEQTRPGESRTLVVIAINAVMMVVEITAGAAYGSIALLADGLHMASHAAALTISAFAYIYARRHASDERFNFGTGKLNSLAGYTGGLLLVLFSLSMAIESVERLLEPQAIAFNEAIAVAVLGLVVNVVSVFILGDTHSEPDHDNQQPHHHDHEACHGHSHGHGHGHDHNLQAAYLHVLADALTSVLAIAGLLMAKHWGIVWIDPLIGILGAVLVARWSVGLMKQTSHALLDMRGSAELFDLIKASLETNGDRVVDLHIWSIGPGIHAVEVTLVSHSPQATAVYRHRLPTGIGLAHIHIEVHSATVSYPPRGNE